MIRRRGTAVVLAAAVLAGCASGPPADGGSGPGRGNGSATATGPSGPPATGPGRAPATGPSGAPATGPSGPRPAPTGPAPVAEPAELRVGAVEIDRPTTAAVTVRPAGRPVSFGRTELRGSAAYELTGDTCSGSTLRPTDAGCRLEVTALARATGDVHARLVLPWNRGTLAVPVSATVPLSYTVVLTVLGSGSVTGDRAGIACSDRCTARVALNALLSLTGSGPARWSGDCTGTSTGCRVRVRTPLEITADFR